MDVQTVERMFPDQPIRSDGEACRRSPRVCIGIFAWNEERVIGSTLESLFRQTIFQEFALRGWTCEVVTVVNGCSDATPQIAEQIFSAQRVAHPFRDAFS